MGLSLLRPIPPMYNPNEWNGSFNCYMYALNICSDFLGYRTNPGFLNKHKILIYDQYNLIKYLKEDCDKLDLKLQKTTMDEKTAEKEITSVFSAGAASDLDAANTLAENMLMQYGLSDGDNKNRSFIVNGNYIKSYLLTESDKKRINKEIKSIIKKAYKKAEKIIKENRQLLDLIANTLLKEIIITGEDMEAIIEKFNNSK